MRYRRCLILEEEKKAFRYDVLHISGNIFFLNKCATPQTITVVRNRHCIVFEREKKRCTFMGITVHGFNYAQQSCIN